MNKKFRALKLRIRLIPLLAASLLFSTVDPVPLYADPLGEARLFAGEALAVQAKAIQGSRAAISSDRLSYNALSSFSAPSVQTVKISSAEDLVEFAQNAKLDSYTYNKTFVLTNDIDLSDAPHITIPSFLGNFDGNGHTISGLKYGGDGYVSALFRYIRQGAVVKDLTVRGAIMADNDERITGGICGINEGIITDCSFEGSIKGRTITGGIAAINEVPGTIMACTNKAAISGYYFTGGIAGKNYGVIAYSFNEGDMNNTVEWVEGSDALDPREDRLSTLLAGGYNPKNDENFLMDKSVDTGGIAGYSIGAVHQCSNTGRIGYEHTGYNVGGIVGRQSGFVSFCENEGTVYGRKDVGGIAGQMEPHLTLSELETLPEAVDHLHDLVDVSLDDMDESTDIITDDVKLLSQFADNAVDAGDALTTTGKDYLNRISDAANSLQARVDYLTEEMPKIIDSFDDAGEELSDAADDIRDLINDSNITKRIESNPDEAKALEEALKTLRETDRWKLSDKAARFEAVKDVLAIVLPESVEAKKSLSGNAKDVHDSIEDISDALDEGLDHTKEVIEHINSMDKPTMPYLGSDFDYSKEMLRASLDGMTDMINILADHSDATSDKLTDDFSSINDQVNVVFHIISDELDRIGNITRGETDEIVTDVSEEDIESIEQGRLDHCVNSGTVEGDINIGGIAGAMSMDTDDPEENAAGSMDGGFTDKYLLRNIILNCSNDSSIESRKDGAGGIVGFMEHGIVAGCESCGTVRSDGEGYAGGIAGQSLSIIKNCHSMSYLDADSYVGGIAGFGTTINDCTAIPAFELENDGEKPSRIGSIAGHIDTDKDTHVQHLEAISGNRFVNDLTGGIDDFSLADHAEPVSYGELTASSNCPEDYKKLLVVYIVDDDIVGSERLPYKTPFSALTFPEVELDEDDGEKYINWEIPDENGILTAPVVIEGESRDIQKTLLSPELYPDTKMSIALVSGNFTEEDSLLASVSLPDDLTVIYNVSFSSENGNDFSALRIYNPFDKYELYGIDADGGEEMLESEMKGSYADIRTPHKYSSYRIENKSRIDRLKKWWRELIHR